MDESSFSVIGKPEVLPVTPDLLKKFGKLELYKGERPYKASRLLFLRSKLTKGVVVTFNWAVAETGSRSFRANGKTSLKALLDHFQEFGSLPDNLWAVITHYACPTEASLSSCMLQFDAKASTRTTIERVGYAKAEFENLDDVSPKIVEQCMAGVMFYKRFVLEEGYKLTDDRLGYLKDQSNREFIRWAVQFLSAQTKNWNRVPIVAAMYATWMTIPQVAAIFWAATHEASDSSKESPTRTLYKLIAEELTANELMELRNNRGKKSNDNRESKWTDRAIFVKCIHAWNAWVRGMTSQNLSYHKDKKVPPIESTELSNDAGWAKWTPLRAA